MEPRSAEQIPTPIEFAPSVPNSPEVGVGFQAERREQVIERAGNQVQQAMPPTVPQSIPLPVAQPASPSVQAVSDDSPSAASDDDLIEKEWVDRAKSILKTTKDDPFAREQAVSRLQSDYLRKRYGKVLGSDNAT